MPHPLSNEICQWVQVLRFIIIVLAPNCKDAKPMASHRFKEIPEHESLVLVEQPFGLDQSLIHIIKQSIDFICIGRIVLEKVGEAISV